MSTIFGFPVVKVGGCMITEDQRQLLLKVWVALRGVGMGAPLDPEYAKELADGINPIIKEQIHVHEFVDARNEAVKSGSACVKCGEMRA